MDIGNVLETFAGAVGLDDELQMAENLFDAAAPLFQLAGAAAPFLAPICPPLALACGTIAAGAQVAQQAGLGNADEQAEQSAKPEKPVQEKPVQTMAKSEEVQPRSAERRETSGRERSETVRERHREPPVRDHRTERAADDRRPVRDHRTDRDVRDHRTHGDERREPIRSRSNSDFFDFARGDSLVERIAILLGRNVQDKVDELDQLTSQAEEGGGEGGGSDTSGPALVIQGKAQALTAAVNLASNTIQNVGQANRDSIGQTAG